ncbi:MAG: translation elongation factor Ts, partial [Patescibacteria group bacterium]
MAIDAEKIKKLREETGAGVLEIKSALEEAGEDYEKAKESLMKKAASKAAKKADRTANDGLVYSYIHNGGKVGSMVLISCETDFVAKTDDFKKLCHEVAMQVCTEDFDNLENLLSSEYIRDPSK